MSWKMEPSYLPVLYVKQERLLKTKLNMCVNNLNFKTNFSLDKSWYWNPLIHPLLPLKGLASGQDVAKVVPGPTKLRDNGPAGVGHTLSRSTSLYSTWMLSTLNWWGGNSHPVDNCLQWLALHRNSAIKDICWLQDAFVFYFQSCF